MLKRFVLGLGLGSALALNVTVASAQSHGGTPEEQKACSRDVARYCKSVMNSDDLTVLGCLQQNRQKLAPACLKVLTSHGV
jgi:Cysteine rich repeat